MWSREAEGHKAVAQCQAYLTHFQDYIDTVRNNVRIAELIQPRPHVRLKTGRPVSQYAGSEGCAGLAGAEPHA